MVKATAMPLWAKALTAACPGIAAHVHLRPACETLHGKAPRLLNSRLVQREIYIPSGADTHILYSSSMPDPHVFQFYHRAMDILEAAGIEYAVGGAYALAVHTGIVRHTKDFDVFLKQESLAAALAAFEREGLRTEMTHPHWIAKAFSPDGELFVDLIYSSGNGLCRVDDEWLANAVTGEVLGRPARLCAAEEILWSKSFIQERERFDGADVAHLLLKRGERLNWDRLLARFGGNELSTPPSLRPRRRGCTTFCSNNSVRSRCRKKKSAGVRCCRGRNT
jgi:hypothetical protein